MKPLKTAAVVVMCLALLAAEGVLLGLFMADTALSEKTIKKSMAESDVIEKLVDEAIAENTVNMGGIYGEFAKDVFSTDPMEDFFVDYLTAAVNTQIYGRAYNEVAYDELTGALVQGSDEVIASGSYDLSPVEADMIIQAIKDEVPTLTAAMDEQVNRYEAVSGNMTEDITQTDGLIKTMLDPEVKTLAMIITIVLIVVIIATCRYKRLGFLWCSIVSLVAGGAYGAISLTGADELMEGMEASPSEEMIVHMVVGGSSTAALSGIAAAVVFLIVFFVLRAADRRKADEQIVEITE